MSQFKQFFGLSCETKILESCGWEEERAAQLMDALSESLEYCIDNSKISIEDVRQALECHESKVESSELEVLLEVIEDAIANFPFLTMEDPEYEN